MGLIFVQEPMRVFRPHLGKFCKSAFVSACEFRHSYSEAFGTIALDVWAMSKIVGLSGYDPHF